MVDTPAANSGSRLDRNIEAIRAWRKREEAETTAQERLAEWITSFAGSMLSVYFHLAFYGIWIVVNAGLVPGLPRWDPTFVVLAMVASVEAIFLTTFVLISQNRMSRVSERQAELGLQVSLLAEHEITKLLAIVSNMAHRFGVRTEADAEISELKQEVPPDLVLEKLEEEQED